MGNLYSPTIFLILGILSFTIVHGQFSKLDGLSDSVKIFAVKMGLDAVKLDESWTEFKEWAIKICTANGGPIADDNTKKSFENFGYCVQSALESEIMSDPTADILLTKIDHYCPKVQPFNICLDQFRDSINPYLDEQKRETVNESTSFVASFLNYICKNKDEHMKNK